MRTILPSILLLLPALTSALTLDCKDIRVERQKFNLAALGGPRTVHNLERSPPSITNTTFTLDLCATLKKSSDVPDTEQCPTGTRVCAVERDYDPAKPDLPAMLHKVIPVAGEYSASNGRALEPKIERLKDGKSNEDAEREGLRIELHGGKYPDTRQGKTQKAIIELVCDREVTGNEGYEGAEALRFGRMGRRKDDEDEKDDEDDDDDDELPDLDKGKSLQFVSYKPEGKDDVGVLRLTWKTKYACEGEADKAPSSPPGGDNESKSSGWGFFTWFIIILFLLAAAYIIFGSWLNYNRYGARGWDLVPHGDTIRDMPYLVKEWSSSVADRLRGSGGSRGGYSAV